MLLLPSCASSQPQPSPGVAVTVVNSDNRVEQYSINFGIDGPIAALANYRGDDADAKLDEFVRGYCGGSYKAEAKTVSNDGRSRGVAFECEKS